MGEEEHKLGSCRTTLTEGDGTKANCNISVLREEIDGAYPGMKRSGTINEEIR